MSDSDFSQRILDNIHSSAQKTSFVANADLDRMNEKHNKHMQLLTNIYEFWTHKTVILILSVMLFLIFLTTRYILVLFPKNSMVKAINADSEKAISYFVTAVASWFITKNLEKRL